MTSPGNSVIPQPAAYLRYRPRFCPQPPRHDEDLHRFATRLGLPEPVLYVDDGPPSVGIPPRLQQLVRAVADGSHRVLLVPGPWVFSTDDEKARRIVRVLTLAGCKRILTLPAPHWRRRRRPVIPYTPEPVWRRRAQS
ncbi:hypothetical protein [Kitasatospora sp. NPDC088346]|uniref:hypothetical protein n=1 Tax=Kitasatospora sp. NPDC088346 TaxID=3364073 RepID=UPI0037FBB656